ncbi:mucin-1-like [Brachyistius frenatus]|uniref:mucin-1-like n=1 Tax=Brachyistius frenatus TaxID=100188 RepID=UPI0037E7716C
MQGETFTPELTDRNSSQFKQLEQRVILTFNLIYISEFGDRYLRCFVRVFRPVPNQARAAGTQADVGVEFNQTTPVAQLPQQTDVSEAIINAVRNSSANFNVSINPDTLQVIPAANPASVTPATAAPASAAPATAATASAAPATAATASAAPATAATASAAPATAAPASSAPVPAAPTTVAITVTVVTFRSVLDTFTTDLLIPSSAAFKSRALMIKNQLEPVFQFQFSSFTSLDVVAFRNGSIINIMNLRFQSTSVPNSTQVANTLMNANVVGFDIEGNSININGISTSSGVSHKISLITASFFVLLSWRLSSQQ